MTHEQRQLTDAHIALWREGCTLHLRSLAATMSQKSSVPQATKFVSQTLKQDSRMRSSKLAGSGHAAWLWQACRPEPQIRIGIDRLRCLARVKDYSKLPSPNCWMNRGA